MLFREWEFASNVNALPRHFTPKLLIQKALEPSTHIPSFKKELAVSIYSLLALPQLKNYPLCFHS